MPSEHLPPASDLAPALANRPAIRLALAYASAASRPILTDLFALDQRLADAVREASEPIIAQLKLAWWRDRFAQSPAEWPRGEPLLARLAQWDADVSRLGALVDGWEHLLADGPLSDEAIAAFGAGHVAAWNEATRATGSSLPDGMGEAARCWAYADLAAHCSDPADVERIRALARGDGLTQGAFIRMPRAIRPLTILGTLGRRSLRSGNTILAGPSDFLSAVRSGMLGR